MKVVCEDWRQVAASEATALVSREARVWRELLAWDVSEAWRPIEPARSAGALPGVIARNPRGRPVGWSCYLEHRGLRQVAMMVADDSVTTATLVHHIADTDPPAGALVCVRDAAPALRPALTDHGFRVGTYLYLCRDLDSAGSTDARGEAWRAGDLDPFVDLCARAYADTSDLRAFAPHGSLDEWREYATGLIERTGCGRFAAAATAVARSSASDRLDAALITTDLGLGTAHVAQLVVDPSSQRRGLATQLLQSTVNAAKQLGYQRLTLLVAETNSAARRLYDTAGFVQKAEFVVALKSG